jgi:hypothetical protein
MQPPCDIGVEGRVAELCLAQLARPVRDLPSLVERLPEMPLGQGGQLLPRARQDMVGEERAIGCEPHTCAVQEAHVEGGIVSDRPQPPQRLQHWPEPAGAEEIDDDNRTFGRCQLEQPRFMLQRIEASRLQIEPDEITTPCQRRDRGACPLGVGDQVIARLCCWRF